MSSTIFGYVYYLVFAILLAAGLYCFMQSSLWRSMFLMDKGDPAFSSVAFYGEYLMITLAACQIVHLVMQMLSRLQKTKAAGKKSCRCGIALHGKRESCG